MTVALETVVKQLEDSGIVAQGKLENFIPPRATPKDAQELMRELVKQKQLTRFQAQEIYQGRVKSLILGNYTILDKIGAGGMGQVFKAEHRRMHRVVAIKMLPKNMMKDAAAVARFEREVTAAAKLRHPNIVAADDADEANGIHFLVMEYIEGSDLLALVKKNGPFPAANVVNCILQAAKGLDFAHRRGVIHRDIKPANLLLDSEGTVKILDMGLARLDAGADVPAQAELTGTGMVMGTVDYMAPEQALSTRHADARADIYSLGCTLYYLLTGKSMFGGDTLMARLLAHREQPIPSLQEVDGGVSEQVEAVFGKMVAKTVERRYQSMTEVVLDLERLSATSTGSSKQETSFGIPQSVATGSDSKLLTFLREIPTSTSPHKTNSAKKSTPIRAGKDFRKLILGAVGVAILAVVILAGVIVRLQTKDGTLVVEINQPEATVQILDELGKIEFSQPGGKGTISISVDPGKHRLKVQKEGFEFFAKDFEMQSGGNANIKATLLPLNVAEATAPTATASKKAAPPKGPAATKKATPPIATTAPPKTTSPPSPTSPEFVSLFNDRDLTGWTMVGHRGWSVKNGTLVGETPGPPGWLMSDQEYTDFELDLEYRLQPDGNSGVFIHAWPEGGDTGTSFHEVQLLDDRSPQYANLAGVSRNGALYKQTSPSVTPEAPANAWNRVKIVVRNQHVLATFNGTKALDADLPAGRRTRGHIGLQLHRPSGVEFRNVRVRELVGAPPPSSDIPADAKRLNGHAYKFFPQQLSWKEAKQRCESLGGRLVVIKNAAENQFVAQLIAAAGWQDAWIGATDESQEGQWTGPNSQPLTYFNWFTNQPNNKGGEPGEDYALISNRTVGDQSINGRWCDQPDQALALHQPGFVCEWD